MTMRHKTRPKNHPQIGQSKPAKTQNQSGSSPKSVPGYKLFLRFLIVGVLNTVFGYLCFVLIYLTGLHYSLAILFAHILGVLFNFKSIGRLVFQSKNNRLILRFTGVYIMVYLASVSGITFFKYQGLNPLQGSLITLLPTAVLSFILNKKLVFQNVQAHQHRNTLL